MSRGPLSAGGAGANGVHRLGILVAMVFGAISAWEGRFDMDADGLSYLDMAEAYARGDWANALNSVWSPLYSWMLVPVLAALRAHPYWEFPAVQGVNLLIYFGTLAAFAYCLRQVVRYRAWCAGDETQGRTMRGIPERTVYAAGYAVFLWGTLIAIGITNVGPHMMLAGLTFLTAGLLPQLRMHPEARGAWAALGFTLGLMFLARAQSLVFVAIYFVLALPPSAGWVRAKRMVARPLLALSILVIVASAYAIPLYAVKKQIAGRDLVKLNYAWYVNGVFIRHWQGDPPYGAPVHPTRVLFTEPTVYEFDGPVGGTYPPWYDPSYWYEGVKPRFELTGHIMRLRESMLWEPANYLTILFWPANAMILVLVAGILVFRGRLPWSSMRQHAYLLIPALVALTTYPALTIMPRRFLGAFLPLLWLGTVAGISWRASWPEGTRLATRVVIGVITFHLAVSGAVVAARAVKSVAPAPHLHWQVAQHLQASGVPDGSKVAIMGGMAYAYWARLARVRIIAEIQTKYAAEFWSAPTERKHELVTRLRAIGVRAIVVHPEARPGAQGHDAGGPWRWNDLDRTGYLALVLR